jgi:hypothetical protein
MEIDAAGGFMGGSAATCNMANMAAMNPCAASVALATCQMGATCGMVCK